jgi:hypothetical protein
LMFGEASVSQFDQRLALDQTDLRIPSAEWRRHRF